MFNKSLFLGIFAICGTVVAEPIYIINKSSYYVVGENNMMKRNPDFDRFVGPIAPRESGCLSFVYIREEPKRDPFGTRYTTQNIYVGPCAYEFWCEDGINFYIQELGGSGHFDTKICKHIYPGGTIVFDEQGKIAFTSETCLLKKN